MRTKIIKGSKKIIRSFCLTFNVPSYQTRAFYHMSRWFLWLSSQAEPSETITVRRAKRFLRVTWKPWRRMLISCQKRGRMWKWDARGSESMSLAILMRLPVILDFSRRHLWSHHHPIPIGKFRKVRPSLHRSIVIVIKCHQNFRRKEKLETSRLRGNWNYTSCLYRGLRIQVIRRSRSTATAIFASVSLSLWVRLFPPLAPRATSSRGLLFIFPECLCRRDAMPCVGRATGSLRHGSSSHRFVDLAVE